MTAVLGAVRLSIITFVAKFLNTKLLIFINGKGSYGTTSRLQKDIFYRLYLRFVAFLLDYKFIMLLLKILCFIMLVIQN